MTNSGGRMASSPAYGGLPAMTSGIDIMPILGIIVPIMGMTQYEKGLSSCLFNKTRRGLLALLFGRPDESFYVNQIVQLLGSGSGAVQRELKMMAEAGIVVREGKGNLVYYRANAQCPIFDELKSIVRKTFGVADVLRHSLETKADKVRVAFIFGSIARSADDRRSDLDVMVIGEITFGEVVDLLSPAEGTLKREVNPVVYPVAEFKQKAKEDHYFVKTVLEDEKIFLIGDEDELRRLAE
jgi:predicted nucleotidyltransferase